MVDDDRWWLKRLAQFVQKIWYPTSHKSILIGVIMKVCTVCHNHILESTCSHCTDRPSTTTKTSTIALSVLLGVGLTACQTGQALYGVPYTVQDLDNDGFDDMEDCNDEDPYTFPGAALEDSDTACMTDFDGDGYGDANPADGVEAGTDCDDTDPTINPSNENCDRE